MEEFKCLHDRVSTTPKKPGNVRKIKNVLENWEMLGNFFHHDY